MAGVILALAVFCGCDQSVSDAPPQENTETIRVQTTVYPLAAIARTVGGNRIEVEWLQESGQSVTALEPDAQRRSRFRSAELVVTAGVGQQWTLEGSAGATGSHRIIRLDLMNSAQNVITEHYLWLNPRIARETVQAIRARLAMIDPRQEAYYAENAQQLIKQIDQLVSDFGPGLKRLEGRKFLSAESGFGALAEAFGLEPVQVSDQPVPLLTPQLMTRLHDLARGRAIDTIFVSVDTPAALQRELQTKTGLSVVTLDALGSSAPAGRSTYPQILRYNLEQIIKGYERQ